MPAILKKLCPRTLAANAAVWALLVCLGMTAVAFPPVRASSETPEEEAERELVTRLNRERIRAGLPELRVDARLTHVARAHTRKMAMTRQLSHQFDDEPAVARRISSAGVHFDATAENVGFAQSAEEIHGGFMRSPGHRANILAADYNAVGIGVAQDGNLFFATEDFARATSDASAEEMERRFAEAFNKFRTSRNLSPVKFEFDSLIREAACRMAAREQAEASMVPHRGRIATVLAFTLSEPERMPERIREISHAPELKGVVIGACFKVSGKYPGGIYWFGMIY